MSDRSRIAVIGVGRWGVRYVSTLSQLAGVDLVVACDVDLAAGARVEALVPGTPCVSSVDELRMLGVEAAIIATPSNTHASVALRCIEAGLHVLVEKPLATHPLAAAEVIAAASRANVVLLPGHVTLHDAGVQRLIELVRAGAVGQPLHFHAERTSHGGRHRTDSALWALGPHDLAMFFSILPQNGPRLMSTLRCQASSDDTTVELAMIDGTRANFRWSRTEQEIVRKVRVLGTTGELSLDEPRGLLRLHGEGRPTRSVQAPQQAPLERQCLHFLDCVRHETRPQPSPDLALAVVSLLATIETELERQRETEHLPASAMLLNTGHAASTEEASP